MADASDIAALMASKGDHEKKISWLKKAIVSVTKQKKELEAQNVQLRDDLLASQRVSEQVREENLKLHKRVSTLEQELEQERRRSSFGQTMLKGLSSLVSNNQVDSAQQGRGVVQHTKRHDEGYALDLSHADVEHIIKQNEDLMIQIYDIKNEYEEFEKSHQRHLEQHQVELASITQEAENLRSLLEDVTSACDALNFDCSRLKAIVQFSRHFFSITSLPPTANALSTGDFTTSRSMRLKESSDNYTLYFRILFPLRMSASHQSLTEDVEELVRGTLQSACRRLNTLVSGVSMLASTFRDNLPQCARATVASLRFSEDRLSDLYEASNLVKERLSYLIKNLEELVLTDFDNASATLAETMLILLANQREALMEIRNWISVVRNHLPLLINGCIAFLPKDQMYCMRTSPFTESVHEVSDREVFVDLVGENTNNLLVHVQACLETMELLLQEPAEKVLMAITQQSSEAFFSASQARRAQLECLMVYQQLWWEGSTASSQLVHAAFAVASVLEDIAKLCASPPVRDVLKYIASNLYILSSYTRARRSAPENKVLGQTPRCTTCSRDPDSVGTRSDQARQSSGELNPRSQCVDHEDLLRALASADRAAVCYYTQMNTVMIELAQKEDIISELQEQLAEVHTRLNQKEVEADQMQAALQEQIKILSEQLIDYTNTSALCNSS